MSAKTPVDVLKSKAQALETYLERIVSHAEKEEALLEDLYRQQEELAKKIADLEKNNRAERAEIYECSQKLDMYKAALALLPGGTS